MSDPGRYSAPMNQTNRLENAWTPAWDLGLQDEFDFGPRPQLRESAREGRRGWSAATAEVLNRPAGFDRRLGLDGSSVGSIIAYFESLGSSEETSARE